MERVAVGVLIVLVGLGCEGEAAEGILFGSVERLDLAGFWTGSEEISGENDIAANTGRGWEDGVTFRVALRLRTDGRFTLRAFNYPVAGHTERRVCTGVWEREGRTLEFFPNFVCRPLPLSRYTIGRSAPDRLILIGRTGGAETGRGEVVGTIGVSLRLDRD